MKDCLFMALVLTLGFSVADVAGGDMRTQYAVEKILAVRSFSQFECQLKDYPYSKAARFRVQIRDVVLDADHSPSDGKAYLAGRLTNAEKIELRNIRFRNYFRVTADVYVDGVGLADEFGKQAVATVAAADARSDRAVGAGGAVLTRTGRLASRSQRTASYRRGGVSAKPVRVTLKSLMDTEVNLSTINDETTLEEALEVMTNSVQPRLPLVILWNDLETNALVDKDMPIGVGGFGTLKLKQALKLILANVSRNGMELELAYEGQVITIGTQRGLLQKSVTRVYSIEDIMSAPSTEYGQGNGNRMGDLMGVFQQSSSR